MKRYVLVTLDGEEIEAHIGKVEVKTDCEELIPDVVIYEIDEIDDETLEEGLPVFTETENKTFKTVVEGGITLLQRAQQIETES